MNTVRKLFFFVMVCVPLLNSKSFAGEHTIAATVEITQTAINRFLNTAYNSWGIPQYVNFPYSGVNYKLALGLPQIILTPGNAKLQMVFDLYNGTTDVYHFVVNPSVNIPAGQVSSPQVQAFLTDLPTQINNISWLPQWVKDTLIHYYNSLGITMYPSELIDTANTQWFARRAILLDSLAVGWQVGQGVIDLIVSTYLYGNTSNPLWLAFEQTSSGHDSLFFGSNFQVTVSQVKVFTEDLQQDLYDNSPNIVCPKVGQASLYIGDLGLASTTYIERIIFTKDNTWYAGEWDISPVICTSPSQDFDASHSISNMKNANYKENF
ncbi:MAG TPA: hypothetical protein VLX91_01885 [Candidatus Acidoferrales bacterium]|nr:hypothetical protein [Candidatus Acidoferrales bacterium]